MPKRNDLEQKALHFVINTGFKGVLQSELWRELDASSREGSRVAIKLEEKGLINAIPPILFQAFFQQSGETFVAVHDQDGLFVTHKLLQILGPSPQDSCANDKDLSQ